MNQLHDEDVDEIRQAVQTQSHDVLLAAFMKVFGSGAGYEWIVQQIRRRQPTISSDAEAGIAGRVLERLWKYIGSFNFEKGFSQAWLKRIIRNCIADEFSAINKLSEQTQVLIDDHNDYRRDGQSVSIHERVMVATEFCPSWKVRYHLYYRMELLRHPETQRVLNRIEYQAYIHLLESTMPIPDPTVIPATEAAFIRKLDAYAKEYLLALNIDEDDYIAVYHQR